MAKRKEEELTYLAPEKNNKTILGTLVGPCADIINPTRNGRGYKEELWEKVFNSDIVKEHFSAGGIFGELGHPAERSETDMEKIAICMKEPPKKGKDGLLIGKWDILDTPNGRILKTLVDYGYKIGISSRGTGDIISDDDGNEQVDSDTYDFQAFDVVLLPAVKAARLTPVVESFGNKTFKQALNEALDKSTDKEKQIMTETLNNLDIKIDVIKEEVKEEIKDEKHDESIPEKVGDKTEDKDSKETNEAIDNGSIELIKSLQETVKAKAESDAKILELQNKLAVSDAKVSKIEEELSRYKSVTIRLSATAKDAKESLKQVSELTERLEEKEKIVKSQRERIQKLIESRKTSENVIKESVSKKELEINKLNESLTTLRTENTNSSKKIQELTESIKILQKTSDTVKTELTEKITKTEKQLERYKRMANDTVKRYIESKAIMLGVTSNEIKNRLSETYTIDDVDRVCEDLKTYSINIGKLPFSIDRKVKVKVTESKKDMLRPDTGMDDEVDDSLLSLANLK